MRGVPAPPAGTFHPATGAPGACMSARLLLAGAPLRACGGDRRRPVTGGAVRGPPPRRRALARRARRSGPPRNGASPG
jgi:hypothetical protein